MKAERVNQYSVFLPNNAGKLSDLAKMLYDEGLDIVGLSSDIRYEAAIVKFIIEPFVDEGEALDDSLVSRLITGAGYTSIKTEVICIESADKAGVILEISKLLGAAGINIITIYGSCAGNKHGRVYVAVENIERAMEILNNAGHAG